MQSVINYSLFLKLVWEKSLESRRFGEKKIRITLLFTQISMTGAQVSAVTLGVIQFSKFQLNKSKALCLTQMTSGLNIG